ncbi:hypothetical protein Tco_0515196 [Tanacetum coccineum]
MDNSKRGHIPMQERLHLNKTQGAQTPKKVNRMKNVPYASGVGSIMYAVRCTRPDVAFAQNMTSRFQQNPGEPHWTAVKNILKYLKNTKDMFLVYGGNPSTELRVECYCDAGFETDRDDTKSQTGYVFVLNGGAVDWKSSMQSTTAMSATESEYIACVRAAKAGSSLCLITGSSEWPPDTIKDISLSFARKLNSNMPGHGLRPASSIS